MWAAVLAYRDPCGALRFTYAEYAQHARKLDRDIHGLTVDEQVAGRKGPVETRLGTFVLEGRVYGTFCDVSDTLLRHLDTVATLRALEWRRMGALSFAEAKSFTTTTLKRRWAAAIWRANARLRFQRLEIVNNTGRAAQAFGADDEPADFVAGGAAFDRGVYADVGGGGFAGEH